MKKTTPRHIIIQSHFGIGDLLFATPSFRVIKESYPSCRIEVNTCYPALLEGNPFVDAVSIRQSGLVLMYPDPARAVHPKCHNIISDWKLVCSRFGLETRPPYLTPELYLPVAERGDTVRVQVVHNSNFYSKRVWPYFYEFCSLYGYDPIPVQPSLKDLVNIVAESRLVVCADSGVQHIAKAVRTPCVVVYGGFSNPAWNGYDSNINLVNFKKCSPCYNRCPCVNHPERACLREITMEQVQAAVEQLLLRTAA